MNTEDKNDQMNQLPKEEGFTTPDGYFDTLNERLVDSASNQKKGNVRLIYGKYAAIGIAASILALVILRTPSLRKAGNEKQTSATIADSFTIHEIEYFSPEVVAEVSEELTDDDIKDEPIHKVLNDEDIIEYLAYSDVETLIIHNDL